MTDEIQVAQERLARALSRAGAGEDKELARQVRETGEQFARILYGLVRLTLIHALDNAAFNQPVSDFRVAMVALWELLGTIHLICVEDQIYVNDVRIRFEVSHEHIRALGEDLRRHGVGGISFNEVFTEPQVRRFIQLVVSPPALTAPRSSLQARLNDEGLAAAELHGVFRFRLKGERARQASRTFKEVYHQSAQVITEAYGNLAANRIPNPLPVRRLINEIIDSTKAQGLGELAQEGEERMPAVARHTLMVTNLALLIGRSAGLSDATLGDLGVTSMFHDLGMALQEDGFPVPYERHHTAGLRSLMRQRGFHEAKVRRLLAVMEHHRNFSDPRGRPSLFARIIHIADDYDILTRYRAGRGPILAPPDALARMRAQAGVAYDPDLMQLFVNQMGLFPPGTILRLASDRIVVSVSGARSPDRFQTPLCRLVRTADGLPAEPGIEVDLALEDRVVKVVRPAA